jgi:phage repressor protein C with HTH and peptisase S24 domain
MEPTIKEGDVAVICPSWEPRHGDEVICRTIHGDVMCKIYQPNPGEKKVILSSYNPAFPPQEFSQDEIEWIYPVPQNDVHLIGSGAGTTAVLMYSELTPQQLGIAT